jgi:hypothetical protein
MARVRRPEHHGVASTPSRSGTAASSTLCPPRIRRQTVSTDEPDVDFTQRRPLSRQPPPAAHRHSPRELRSDHGLALS